MRLIHAGKMITRVGELSIAELRAIKRGRRQTKILSEMDFFETLAQMKCIIAPPWVLRLREDGGMERVARVTYDEDLNLERTTILLKVFGAYQSRDREGAMAGK